MGFIKNEDELNPALINPINLDWVLKILILD
jgi:hypothetical protein